MSKQPTLSIVALVVVALAACAGPAATPSTTPISLVTAAPTLTPTVAPSLTPIKTTEPTFACPSDLGAIDVSVVVRGGGSFGFELDTDPLPSPEAVDSTIVPIESTVIGGTDLTAELRADEDAVGSIAITALTAEFLPFGSASPLLVPSKVNDAGASMRFPDADVEGQLRVTIGWTSPCGEGQGSGSVGLAVVNSQGAADCPAAGEGFDVELAALAKVSVQVGTLGVQLGVYQWSGRWTGGNGADDFGTLFPNWKRDPAIVAAPGTSIIVRESEKTLDVQSIRASIYLRADVDAYFEPGSDQEIDVFDVLRRSPGPLGRVGIPVPLEPGRYVFDLEGAWLTPCLELQTTETVSVEVR